jgi:RNA polymerase sigma-70 factor (ECF subfamily)
LAEEALLDAYTYVWKQAAFYNPKTMKPLEWLILIGRSRAVLHLNIGKQNPKGHSLPQSAASASEMSVAPEQQKLARDSIASLIPSQREVLESAFYSGLSCSDIAAQSGKPAGAVTTHIRLGLNKLDELFR